MGQEAIGGPRHYRIPNCLRETSVDVTRGSQEQKPTDHDTCVAHRQLPSADEASYGWREAICESATSLGRLREPVSKGY